MDEYLSNFFRILFTKNIATDFFRFGLSCSKIITAAFFDHGVLWHRGLVYVKLESSEDLKILPSYAAWPSSNVLQSDTSPVCELNAFAIAYFSFLLLKAEMSTRNGFPFSPGTRQDRRLRCNGPVQWQGFRKSTSPEKSRAAFLWARCDRRTDPSVSTSKVFKSQCLHKIGHFVVVSRPISWLVVNELVPGAVAWHMSAVHLDGSRQQCEKRRAQVQDALIHDQNVYRLNKHNDTSCNPFHL